jgi:urea transporter/tetratricopeptide (TPR) repeat protein/murein DD-endopeptidase MepM/ murein hydrolase activator NlpD
MNERLRALFTSSAEILFLRSAVCGAIVLAVAALQPSMALLGGLALMAAYAAACLIGLEGDFRQSGGYVYNPLLVGLSIGYRCELTVSSALLVALAGVLTLIVTALAARLLLTAGKLPMLSLPFALVSTVIYVGLLRTPGAVAEPLPAWLTSDLGLPLWLAGFFRALGGALFAPHVIVGILLSAMIASASRIQLVLAVGGYYLGAVATAVMHNSLPLAWNSPYDFNSILIAMALGGVLLVPSLQTFVITMLGVAVSPLVFDAVSAVTGPSGAPPFTLPFCLVTIGSYAALRCVNYPLLATGLGGTPEEVRENSIVNRLRYPGSIRTCSLPFAGQWTVWQGFNGRWTHKGIWRYAYDFVVTDEAGQTHRGEGTQLQDYYCYRMPVLSPVVGRVVRVLDHLPDNAVGRVSGGNNWGNLVMLLDSRGFYVELSHFAPQSIRVKEGDWVERGMLLGLCGNSGYSPQPHIHMQVQASDSIAAATLPFSFVCYQQGDVYHANDLPAVGARVEQLCLDKQLNDATTALLDDVHEYEVFCQGRLVDQVRWTVGIGADGCHYFESPRGRLYFGKHEGTLHLYSVTGDDPHLRRMMLAVPRLPLAYKMNSRWHDYVPASVVLSGGRLIAARLASLFVPRASALAVRHEFRSRHQIRSVVAAPWLGVKYESQIELDSQGWFTSVKVGDYELRRRRPAADRPQQALTPPRSRRRRMQVAASYAAACVLALVVCGGAVQKARQREPLLLALYNSAKAESHFNYPAAISAITAQQASFSDDYAFNARLGWLNYLSAQYDTSEEYYQAAIAAMPTSLEARQGCLLPMLAKRRYRDAEEVARELLERDPANYYGRLRLAVALRLQSRIAEAREALAPLEEAFPTDAGVMAELANLDAIEPPQAGSKSRPSVDNDAIWRDALRESLTYEIRGDYAAAAKALNGQKLRLPGHYLLNLRLGWLNYLQRQYLAATKYYKEAQQARPKSREAPIGQILVLMAQKRYAEVETVADGILAADPNHYDTNLRLAVALRLSKKPEKANKILAQLATLYPTDAAIKSESALTALALRDSATAQRLFGECLALWPDHVEARKHVRW